MVKIFTLPTQDNSLHVEVAENGWARLTLVGEGNTYLGADAFEVIAPRLLNYLKTGDVLGRAYAGEVDGLPVSCLLLLSEAHHALYVGSSGSERILFWQNAHQSPVTIAGIMRLSPDECRHWAETLTAALDAYREPTAMSR